MTILSWILLALLIIAVLIIAGFYAVLHAVGKAFEGYVHTMLWRR